jgi:hypothetical protein
MPSSAHRCWCICAGISVGFNFLGRDFFNAISEKARGLPRAFLSSESSFQY